MVKKKREWVRANEFWFGQELARNEEFQKKLSDADRKRIEAGQVIPLNIYLLQHRKALSKRYAGLSERDDKSAEAERFAIESILTNIDYALRLIKEIRSPIIPSPALIYKNVGLLGHACIAIGSEIAALDFEHGEIGKGTDRDKHGVEKRKGSFTPEQRRAYRKRNREIRQMIQERLDAGQIYKAALQDVLDNWKSSWIGQMNIATLRTDFPKHSFRT